MKDETQPTPALHRGRDPSERHLGKHKLQNHSLEPWNYDSAPRTGRNDGVRDDAVRVEETRHSDSTTPPRESETVLVVEDERVVREVTASVLRHKGYTVFEAAEGVDAIGLVLGHPGTSIDLLVADVVMPLMNGCDLADRLRAGQASMRVLFISGYSGDMISHPALQDRGAAFIAKPFTPEQLSQKVRALLGAREGVWPS